MLLMSRGRLAGDARRCGVSSSGVLSIDGRRAPGSNRRLELAYWMHTLVVFFVVLWV